MNYAELLGGKIGKANIDQIVAHVNQYPDRLEQLYRLTFDEDQYISWRSLWACEKIAEQHPDWFIPRQPELIDRLLTLSHNGKKRLLLSILYDLPLPEPYSVPFLDYVLEHMLDPKETAGVQSLCIKHAYRLCKVDVDLLSELQTYLEDADLLSYSPGVRTAIRNIKKQLNR